MKILDPASAVTLLISSQVVFLPNCRDVSEAMQPKRLKTATESVCLSLECVASCVAGEETPGALDSADERADSNATPELKVCEERAMR